MYINRNDGSVDSPRSTSSYPEMVDNNNPGASGAAKDDDIDGVIKEQDQLLPIANVGRIMKQILPPNAKISKEAKETMQECASEFISFVTGEASEKCLKERRKTVNGDDVCWALGALGFNDYTGPLRRYLHRYREQERDRISSEANNNINEDHQRISINNIPHTQGSNYFKGSSTSGCK